MFMLHRVWLPRKRFGIIGGDFNADRFREEKRNCSFKASCASNFNAFIFEADLIEFDIRGRCFTWQSEKGNKLSKLDRFLVNLDFFNKWPEAHVQALPRLWSDQCPIVLSTKPINFGARPFRVFNSWLGKEGFTEVVEEACNSFSAPGCPPDIFLIKKLEFIRNKFKEWRNVMRLKECEVLELAKEELIALESLLDSRDLSEEEEWALIENKKVIAEIELGRIMDLKQRSRANWAKEGDENSKLFHSLINCRKASNVIHGLDVGGEWVSKPSLVKKEVLSFFRSKFVEESANRPKLHCHNMRRISAGEADLLEAPFNMEEIKSAVFECGDDRAPGPDGFNFRFYKRFWSLLEADFVNLLVAFLDLGVINKVVSKILANRLKMVLGSVISNSQSAFLGGRSILDGPLIINEVCSWIKKRKKKALLLKIDFEKAYDNINWGFVVDVFRQMGFGSRWCKWLWGILSSARASVLVNV
ncbi:putative RNA-directed DNA polymerase [Helianthus annuus]|nr:putative RNA-directed DNA polymerase [Helianthus annuus]